MLRLVADCQSCSMSLKLDNKILTGSESLSYGSQQVLQINSHDLNTNQGYQIQLDLHLS
jgi:hypothetical protein